MRMKTLKLAVRLAWLDIKKTRKFDEVSWAEAIKRTVRKYQVKGQAIRERKNT